jgi:oxygen-independent coproporphyrinogen-3 oxidase
MRTHRRSSPALSVGHVPVVASIVRAAHLYVHVPFCARRCVYCDFSIAVRPRVPTEEYLTALDSELRARHANSEFDLDTLYLGGGTPSKLGGDGVARLIDLVRRRARLRDGAEVTLEANPEDVTAQAVRDWTRAGVNRLSLGVQSFDDTALVWMHRTHDAAAALAAIETARDQGIENVSVDLIFALPVSIERSWERDLDTAMGLELPHLSVYGLTVEEQTPLGRRVARNDVTEAPEESFERDFLLAHELLSGAGFEHYEVSNYGRPGRHSRHNWAYWRRLPYGGVGPSAHEFDGSGRRWNVAPYADWVARTARQQDPVGGREELATDQATAETVYLALRTTVGLDLAPDELPHVAPWVTQGWAELNGGSTLRLTGSGWLRLDAVASDLTLVRSR